jgi:hypothetical protein
MLERSLYATVHSMRTIVVNLMVRLCDSQHVIASLILGDCGRSRWPLQPPFGHVPWLMKVCRDAE